MLLEHAPPGSAILSVSATDRDSGANGHISYHLASPAEGFSVDPNNGTSFGDLLLIPVHVGPYILPELLPPRSLIQGRQPPCLPPPRLF